ncbi:MAG: peroxide stress protein YaaA [Myxococcota bacterium]
MLAVLSPAKSLNLDPIDAAAPATAPALMDDARSLMRTARGLTQKKIRALMGVSADLAKLNYDRYRSFELPFTPDNALPAALTFDGDVYRGLSARTLADDDLVWAQDHVAILSGLFGVLRPLDLVQPHRLEMGTRLKTRRGTNLYAFWGDRVTDRLNATLEGHDVPVLVNLASQEYFKVVRPARLAAPVVTCAFHDWKQGQEPNVISFCAKYARGLMARFIIEQRVDRPKGLRDFALERYAFVPDQSTDDHLVFGRPFVAKA